MPNSRAPGLRSRIKERGEAGFTLIEMVVVLAVLGLVLAILVSRGPTRSPTIDLTAAQRSLTGALRHARALAITTGRPTVINVAELREALARGAYRDAAGVIAASLHSPPDDPRPNGTLRFDPDGSANGARIVLSEGRESVSITVDWLTGRIAAGPIRRGDDAS